MTTERTSLRAGIAVLVAQALLIGTAVTLAVTIGSSIDLAVTTALLLTGLIAALLTWKRPAHGVSRALVAAAILGGCAAISSGGVPDSTVELADWQIVLGALGGAVWFGFIFTIVVYMPLVFPTGQPPTRRWRWPLRIGLFSTLAIAAMFVVEEKICADIAEQCVYLDNPIGIPGVEDPESSAVGSVLFAALLLSMVAAVVSVVVRFVRARDVERQQLKWLVFSLLLLIGSILIIEIGWQGVLDQPEPPGYGVFTSLVWLTIPAAIALAILRYRLYEIDRIISRTVSYAVLTALLAGVYVAGVFGLGAVARGVSGDSSSGVVVAASTLAVAALFGPLRRMVQRVIDRRFNRHRLDAERELAAYTAGLRSEVEPTGVTSSLVGVVSRTVQPASTGVWIRH